MQSNNHPKQTWSCESIVFSVFVFELAYDLSTYLIAFTKAVLE